MSGDKPDIYLFIGSNDIDDEDMNISTIPDGIIGIGEKCAMFCVKDLVILSIFLRRHLKLTKSIRQVNDNFHFVCNDNVTKEYLWRDDIHLNNESSRIFADKLVDYLSDFISSKNIRLLKIFETNLKQFSEDSETKTFTNNCCQNITAQNPRSIFLI